MDANDLPPSFSPLPPGPSLSEDTVTGTLVASVTATDGDSGSNGEVRGHLCCSYDRISVVCVDSLNCSCFPCPMPFPPLLPSLCCAMMLFLLLTATDQLSVHSLLSLLPLSPPPSSLHHHPPLPSSLHHHPPSTTIIPPPPSSLHHHHPSTTIIPPPPSSLHHHPPSTGALPTLQ